MGGRKIEVDRGKISCSRGVLDLTQSGTCPRDSDRVVGAQQRRILRRRQGARWGCNEARRVRLFQTYASEDALSKRDPSSREQITIQKQMARAPKTLGGRRAPCPSWDA